jgi:hypothetical protein
MSLSPQALDAYVREVARERQHAAAHAALVALARQARPPSRTRLAAAGLFGPLGLIASLFRR